MYTHVVGIPSLLGVIPSMRGRIILFKSKGITYCSLGKWQQIFFQDVIVQFEILLFTYQNTIQNAIIPNTPQYDTTHAIVGGRRYV